MKRLLLLVFAGLLFEGCYHGPDDKYYHLTQEQLDFINTPKTGDTCIWESSLGYRDTAIVHSLAIRQYAFHSQHSGTEYAETGGYSYKYIGKKNGILPDLIGVEATPTQIQFVYLGLSANVSINGTTGIGSGFMKGMFQHKTFDNITYSNVYWGIYKGVDSVFFSKEGVLGYKSGNEVLEKIR